MLVMSKVEKRGMQRHLGYIKDFISTVFFPFRTFFGLPSSQGYRCRLGKPKIPSMQVERGMLYKNLSFKDHN